MVSFDPAHQAVHYPPDRRFRMWIRPSILAGIGIAVFAAVAAAWMEVALDCATPSGTPLLPLNQ